jgi:hypothetical protein
MKILTPNHIITGNEYFRQKAFCPYDSDNYAVSTFICKWASIRYLIGDVWKNRALNELDKKDTHYPYNPSFLNQHEFIEFENDEEKALVDIYSYDDIREIDNRRSECYKSWNDWAIHYISNLTEEEIINIYNTPENKCPYCNEGLIIEKHGKYGKFNACNNYPKCKYVENKLSDTYSDYCRKAFEIKELKKAISTMFQINNKPI